VDLPCIYAYKTGITLESMIKGHCKPLHVHRYMHTHILTYIQAGVRYARMLKHTLEGHRKAVYCIATSRDGKLIASGSEDKTVRIWDSETGQLKFMIKNEEAVVLCLCFNRDSKVVVGGCSDGRMQVWEVSEADGVRLVRTQDDHATQVECVQVSPDGQMLASSCEEGPVIISDMHSGARVFTLKAHVHALAVFCVAWSADGQLVASAGEDGHVIVWRARDGTQHGAPLKGHKSQDIFCRCHSFCRHRLDRLGLPSGVSY
jgi:WD40 repeat protein